MNLKEITSKAGSISDYLNYIILLFGLNSVNNLYDLVVPESSGFVFELVSWGLKLLVGPIVLAIIFGGIYERQSVQEELERKSFLSHIKTYGLRFIGAGLLSLFFYYIVLISAFLLPVKKR